ncbi:MAG: hypothetical protein COB23_06470 [Methylophaga sp.]|nr:MAG: hypothetical protein COB23_06470 [Methylophaga sp.]
MNLNHIRIIKVLPLALIYFSPVTHAAEWSLTGNLNPSAEYDDNTFLSNDEESSMHYAVTPTLTIARGLENSEMSLSLGYQIDKYIAISDNDTENPFIELNSSYNTERSQYGLAMSYKEDTTRNNAVEDTGDFTTRSTVRTRSINPSYGYQLTERDSLSLTAGYSEREYSTDDFSDNETKSLSAGWQREFSERLSAGLDLTASNYQADSSISSTDDDTYGIATSFTYELSELWDISGSIGLRRLNSERKTAGITNSDQSSGSTLDFSATRTREIDTFTINLARVLSPSSDGDVNEQDRLSMSWSRNLSERLTMGADFSYQESTNASDDSSDEKRENINFSPALTWSIEENLDLIMAYSYRKQKRSGGSSAGSSNDSNAISLTLSYNWEGIRFSR